MATKPTIALARFADTGGADVTAPSSGLRDSGFVFGTLISQSFVNYLFNQNYQWSLYLSDGALVGDHSIDGKLTVGGAALVIPATVFTAANGTEIFTSAAHGFQTGDGPVRVANSGGALPAGLSAGTDYWVIRIDANTFYLATSFANAIAGIFLLISTDGTGTQTIFSTGATTRKRDAEVTRNLTVDGNVASTGSLSHRTRVTLPSTAAVILGTATRDHSRITLPSATAAAAFPLLLPMICQTIQLVAFVIRTDNTAQVTIALMKCDFATATVSTVASATLSGSGAGGTESLPVNVSYALNNAEEAWIEVSFTGGSSSQLLGVNVFQQ